MLFGKSTGGMGAIRTALWVEGSQPLRAYLILAYWSTRNCGGIISSFSVISLPIGLNSLPCSRIKSSLWRCTSINLRGIPSGNLRLTGFLRSCPLTWIFLSFGYVFCVRKKNRMLSMYMVDSLVCVFCFFFECLVFFFIFLWKNYYLVFSFVVF